MVFSAIWVSFRFTIRKLAVGRTTSLPSVLDIFSVGSCPLSSCFSLVLWTRNIRRVICFFRWSRTKFPKQLPPLHLPSFFQSSAVSRFSVHITVEFKPKVESFEISYRFSVNRRVSGLLFRLLMMSIIFLLPPQCWYSWAKPSSIFGSV